MKIRRDFLSWSNFFLAISTRKNDLPSSLSHPSTDLWLPRIYIYIYPNSCPWAIKSIPEIIYKMKSLLLVKFNLLYSYTFNPRDFDHNVTSFPRLIMVLLFCPWFIKLTMLCILIRNRYSKQILPFRKMNVNEQGIYIVRMWYPHFVSFQI